MNVLIVGGGGREHALAWKAAQSARVAKVYVAPGNAGTAREAKCENVAIAAEDVDALLHFAQQQKIDLTLIGPEAPLALGIVDRFRAAKLRCFGPTQAAAQLEGSKLYAKQFLFRHGIPTAQYRESNDFKTTEQLAATQRFPCVLKADGLAAGKGVVIVQNREELLQTAREFQLNQALGTAGARLVIEEFLEGEEASFIVMADGKNILPLATSQDHKRVGDGDIGPNTGGMGAYSPAPVVTEAMHARIMREVIEPTIRGMQADGIPYTGFLYAGLMIAADGTPNVLEYNCRFGDPETQPILLRLKSDLIDLVDAALDGRLDRMEAEWDARAALGVVMAAKGYPGAYPKGDAIAGLDAVRGDDIKVFHAGTAMRDRNVVTSGGRVLCVTALGATVAAAQTRAYDAVQKIRWPGAHYRNDIGHRAIAREKTS